MKLWVLFILVGLTLSNFLIAHNLDDALERVKQYEESSTFVLTEFENLATCAAQCDNVILQRQNLIVGEIQRLDHNQQQLIKILNTPVSEWKGN